MKFAEQTIVRKVFPIVPKHPVSSRSVAVVENTLLMTDPRWREGSLIIEHFLKTTIVYQSAVQA